MSGNGKTKNFRGQSNSRPDSSALVEPAVVATLGRRGARILAQTFRRDDSAG
jgi:hypothetical protein